MPNDVKRFVVDIQGREARECVFAADHDRIASALTDAGTKLQAERDQWQREAIRLASAVCALGKMEFDQLTDDTKLIEVMSVIREAIQERNQLAERCRELEVERDEADRRAGAAERKLAEEVDSRRRRETWLHKAKEEAGYAQEESFDNVWAETLGKANERDALRAEVERLTGCLQKANEQAEHFEREWYLRGDEVERLRKDAERYRFIRDIPHTFQVQECLRFQRNSVMDDIIDAALEASR